MAYESYHEGGQFSRKVIYVTYRGNDLFKEEKGIEEHYVWGLF